MSPQEKRITAIKLLLQDFAMNDLKINATEWKKIEIAKIEQDNNNKCEVVHVTFKTHEDIAAVNSKFINLNDKSNNKNFQYVPKALKKRFKAYETAAYQIRTDEFNLVNTK